MAKRNFAFCTIVLLFSVTYLMLLKFVSRLECARTLWTLELDFQVNGVLVIFKISPLWEGFATNEAVELSWMYSLMIVESLFVLANFPTELACCVGIVLELINDNEIKTLSLFSSSPLILPVTCRWTCERAFDDLSTYDCSRRFCCSYQSNRRIRYSNDDFSCGWREILVF